MGVKIAFLYDLIEVEIYINKPHRFNDKTAWISLLLRASYELKQFLQIWYDILVVFLKSYEISLLKVDLSVYAKLSLIIAIFVNNLLITSNSISEIKAAKTAFYTQFGMLNLTLCKYYLGMIVTQDYKN